MGGAQGSSDDAHWGGSVYVTLSGEGGSSEGMELPAPDASESGFNHFDGGATVFELEASDVGPMTSLTVALVRA